MRRRLLHRLRACITQTRGTEAFDGVTLSNAEEWCVDCSRPPPAIVGGAGGAAGTEVVVT